MTLETTPSDKPTLGQPAGTSENGKVLKRRVIDADAHLDPPHEDG